MAKKLDKSKAAKRVPKGTDRGSAKAVLEVDPDSEVVEIVPAEGELEVSPDDSEVSGHDQFPEIEVDAREEEERGSGALVPYNPLDAYLSEIRRFRPLTREEEHETAVDFFRTKSSEAAYKLVSSNLWLVVKIARDYERVARNVLDLIQEGNIGLMEAVKNFDPYRGVRFPSYAVWWIKAYIIRYIIANWRLVKIGTTQAQRKLFFNLKKESEKLEREGIFPTPKLLAERLNVREGDVIEMTQRLSGPDVSVDAPLQDQSDNNLLSLLPSDRESIEDSMAKRELHRLLTDSVEKFEEGLSAKERTIFRGRIIEEDKLTLQELSDELSLSKERVRQIENKLREKLKVFVSGQLGSELEEWMDTTSE